MDLAEIGIHAALRIGDDSARLPGLPQPIDDLDPLVGDLVALVMFVVTLEAEVLRRTVVVRRHEIEADAALGEVVEGRPQACRQIGRIEAGGHGGDDAEMARPLRQQGDQRHRIVLGHRVGVVQIPFRRAAVGVGHEGAILDHHVVETGPLHRPDEIDVEVRCM